MGRLDLFLCQVMDFKVEENSSIAMRRSCLCFCLACGATGLEAAVDGKKKESLDQGLDQDGQLSAFLLLKGCSRCPDGKVYKLSDCDYFSRIRVGLYLSEILRVAVREFADDIDFAYHDQQDDAEDIVKDVITESQELFNAEVGHIEWSDEYLTRERKVPNFWKESVEKLFNVNSVVSVEDCDSDQLTHGVELVSLES